MFCVGGVENCIVSHRDSYNAALSANVQIVLKRVCITCSCNTFVNFVISVCCIQGTTTWPVTAGFIPNDGGYTDWEVSDDIRKCVSMYAFRLGESLFHVVLQ